LALQAEVRDDGGNVLADPNVTWSSSDTSVVVVTSGGVVTGRSMGEASVAATAEGHTGSATINVVPVSPDSRAPSLSAFSFSPDSLDLSEGSDSTTVTFQVSDGGSGTDRVVVQFRSPGANYQYQTCAGERVAGTAQAGTWKCAIAIPQAGAAGEWYAHRVELSDSVGNSSVLVESALQAAGFNTKLWVDN
jgi:hypothetical protein